MLTIGIFLLFLTGFLVISALSVRFTLIERCGLAFPVGTGLLTFVMLLADGAGIPLNAGVNMVCALLPSVAAGVYLWLRHRADFLDSLRIDVHGFFSRFNLLWLALLIVLVWAEYANLEKCMFFPTYDRDSMAAFDTIGYLIAQEQTLRGLSIFQGDYMTAIHGAGSTISYTPMLQLSYAYVYSLGAETSKIIPGLMFLSFLFAFYGLTARFTSRTAAMAATLLMAITPEMIAFSSLSATNVIHAVTASTGLLYVVAWLVRDERRDLWLGCLLLAVNVWCRAEGVVFIGAAGLLVLIQAIRKHAYMALLPVVLSLVPAFVWALFLRVNHMYAEGILITHPFWDADKFSVIYSHAKALVINTQYYGWTFTAWLLALIANAWFAVKRRDSLWLLSAFVISFVAYFVVLYQIEYKWDRIENVLNYSAKRFLFCYVPVAWFYVVTCYPVRTCMQKLDDWLSCNRK